MALPSSADRNSNCMLCMLSLFTNCHSCRTAVTEVTLLSLRMAIKDTYVLQQNPTLLDFLYKMQVQHQRPDAFAKPSTRNQQNLDFSQRRQNIDSRFRNPSHNSQKCLFKHKTITSNHPHGHQVNYSEPLHGSTFAPAVHAGGLCTTYHNDGAL